MMQVANASAPIGSAITGVNDTPYPERTQYESSFNPEEDCWTSGFPVDPDVKAIAQMSADAKYLASIPTTFISSRMNTPQAILRAKQVQNFNLFMMNHPWRNKGVDDLESENKTAYDAAYIDNPQHVADARAFEEAEARIKNKNSILRAVMSDPGAGVLDVNNEEPDQIALLQKSNQSFISARDKYFIAPRPVGERTSARDDEMLNSQFNEMGVAINTRTAAQATTRLGATADAELNLGTL